MYSFRSIRFFIALAAIVLLLTFCKLPNRGREYIGVFELDMLRTDFGSYVGDTASFRQLTLMISEDGSFSFNFDVPFIASQSGSWEVRSYDGIELLHLVYGKRGNVSMEDQVNTTASGDLFIRHTWPKPHKKSLPLMYLRLPRFR